MKNLLIATTLVTALLGSSIAQAEGQWTIVSTKEVSAVSWHAEIVIKCTAGRHNGELNTILVMDNGYYASVYGPTKKSLEEVANFHCD